MRITARKVNKKRHTIGYKVGGRWYTRRQAVELALGGKIEGVSVYRRSNGKHIQSVPSANIKLYELQEVVA